jgi:hypothetical protein
MRFGEQTATETQRNTPVEALPDVIATDLVNKILELAPQGDSSNLRELCKRLITTIVQDERGHIHLYCVPLPQRENTKHKGSSQSIEFPIRKGAIMKPKERYQLGQTRLIIELDYYFQKKLKPVIKLYNLASSQSPFFSTHPLNQKTSITCSITEEQGQLHRLAQLFSDYVTNYFETDKQIETISQAP